MMSLTSTGFQWTMIIATVAVSIATLLLWNRIRGPRAVRLLARSGLLGSSYVLAAVAALVSINIAYGGLISGWAELFDNLGSAPSTAHHGRHSGLWQGRPGGPGPGRPAPGQGAPGPPGDPGHQAVPARP